MPGAGKRSGSVAFFGDDGAGKGNALAAFGLTTHRPIGLTGAFCTGTSGGADILFADGITDANDHETSLEMREGILG